MKSETLMILCWLALGVTALVSVGGAAVGAAYHPGARADLFVYGLVPVLVVAAVLIIIPRVDVAVRRYAVAPVAALLGLGFAGRYGYQMSIDPGDVLLWAAPALLGLGLVGLGFRSYREDQV